MTEIIRKPANLYPIPPNVRDLDNPYPDIIRSRHTRVPTFKEGYKQGSGDDPTKVVSPVSPSKILSKI